MGTHEPCIAAAATAGVEHKLARQVLGHGPGLDLKHRFVFLRPSDVVAIPLPAEARGVRLGLSGQPGNPVNDRHGRRAAWACQLPRWVAHDFEIFFTALGTTHQFEQFMVHGC